MKQLLVFFSAVANNFMSVKTTVEIEENIKKKYEKS